MAAGCAVGLIVTAILGGLGVAGTVKRAKSRVHTWWYFAVAFAVVLFLLIFVVHEYPYAQTRAGSDYDIVVKNLFLQGLGYCAAPGIAAFFATLAAMLSPKIPTAVSTGSDPRNTLNRRHKIAEEE